MTFWVSVYKWEQFVYNDRVIIVITSFNLWALASVFTKGRGDSLQAEVSVSERQRRPLHAGKGVNSSYVSPSWAFNYQTSSFSYSLLRNDSLVKNFQWDSGR